MTDRTRRAVLGSMALLSAAVLLSGCSVGSKYAATINDEGHVQIEWCNASADLVVETSPGNDVLELSAKRRTGTDFVDVEEPSTAWIVTGDLDMQSDTVLTVWQATDFAVANSSTTTAATTTTSSRFAYEPEPVLVVAVDDLRPGAYFHNGENISKGQFEDECTLDSFRLSDLLLIVLPILGILFVIVFVLVSLVTGITERSAARRRARRRPPAR